MRYAVMKRLYTTKPFEIEAVEWTGKNPFEICSFVGTDNIASMKEGEDFFLIKTLEGDMRASKGDFIIKGIRGEFYPCKPDVFKVKYKEKDKGVQKGE